MTVYGDGWCAMGDHPAQLGRLMCAQHWRQVPRSIQLRVNVVFGRWLSNDCTLGKLRAAQDEAVRSIGGTPRSDP